MAGAGSCWEHRTCAVWASSADHTAERGDLIPVAADVAHEQATRNGSGTAGH